MEVGQMLRVSALLQPTLMTLLRNPRQALLEKFALDTSWLHGQRRGVHALGQGIIQFPQKQPHPERVSKSIQNF